MVAGAVVLLVAAPLITGDVELFFLNLVGLGIGALLLRRFMPPASGRQAASTLTTGVSGSLIPIPNTQGPSPSGGRPFFYARKRAQSARPQSKGTKEVHDDDGNTGNWNSVDGHGGQAPAQPSKSWSTSSWRRWDSRTLRRRRRRRARCARSTRPGGSGRQETSTARWRSSPGVDAEKAETKEARWAFSEWTQLVKRRFGGRGALVYSQGTGRAAALVPTGDGGSLEVAAVLGMRWRPGKVVSGRSLRGLRPLTGGA